VEFRFSEHRDLLAAKRFFRPPLEHHGLRNRGVIDGRQTSH
jgi:transposase-like protein